MQVHVRSEEYLCNLRWLSLACRCLLILKFLTQAVEVAESFRLFATVTTSKHDVSHALEGSFVWLNYFVWSNYCVITSALLRSNNLCAHS